MAEGKLGLPESVSIGIGGMVGGGIFAVLGVAVAQGGSLAWISFGMAGVVALLTAYAFWRFGLAFPSQGGAVEYLNRSFGISTWTGGVNWMLWLGYMLMISVYAFAFGAYGAQLLPGPAFLWQRVLTSLIIVGMVGVNALGAGEVGRVEDIVVYVKVAILLLFVAVGFLVVAPAQALEPPTGGGTGVLFAGVLIFLAYEGFELVANATEDMREPRRTLPRALFLSVGFVVALYVAIAFVAVGSLPVATLVDAKEFALARAAEPALGSGGFLLIIVAAMLSTAGAINSTLYGTQRLTFVMACERELPREFEATFRGRHLAGLLATGGVALFIANLVSLEGLALLASSVFLFIFGLVNLAAVRVRKAIDARLDVPLAAAVACFASFSAVVAYSALQDPLGILFLLVIFLASFGLEWGYRRFADSGRAQPGVVRRP